MRRAEESSVLLIGHHQLGRSLERGRGPEKSRNRRKQEWETPQLQDDDIKHAKPGEIDN
jgi:hypothetical protein